MTMLSVSKAKTAKDRCEHCGRPVGNEVEQCRQVRSGWYCWMRGLIFDVSSAIMPTADPIGEAEQAVLDEYAPHLAAAQKAVDDGLASYTLAQQAHRAGLFEGAEINVGPLLIPPSKNRTMRQASEAERKRMARRLETLGQGEETTGLRLQKARRKLQHLEAQCDHKRRVARQPITQEEEL